ncbi:MAG: hypothetical protein AB7P21_06390 [Lautropia sp.]
MTVGMLIARLRRLGVHYQGLELADLPTRIDADLQRFDADTPVAGFLAELGARLREHPGAAESGRAAGAPTQIQLTL